MLEKLEKLFTLRDKALIAKSTKPKQTWYEYLTEDPEATIDRPSLVQKRAATLAYIDKLNRTQ